MTIQWKTLEARDKLLAAVVAAMGAKNIPYKTIAEFYGDGATYSSVEFQFRQVRGQAEELRKAKQLRDGTDSGEQPGTPARSAGTGWRGGGALTTPRKNGKGVSVGTNNNSGASANGHGNDNDTDELLRTPTASGSASKRKRAATPKRGGAEINVGGGGGGVLSGRIGKTKGQTPAKKRAAAAAEDADQDTITVKEEPASGDEGDQNMLNGNGGVLFGI